MQFELDEDDPAYGIFVQPGRPSTWWHGHLFRSNLRYPSRAVRRPTGLLFGLQLLGIGVAPLSPRYLFTLDGAGLELPADCILTGAWFNAARTRADRTSAVRSARRAVDALNRDDRLLRAIEHVVRNQCHDAFWDPTFVEVLPGPPGWD